MKFFFLYSAILLITSNAYAKFEIQTSTGYSSNTDGKTKNSFTDISNHVFLGASFDNKDRLIIGQNISIISNQFKTTTTDKISTLEFGPRIQYYINEDKNYYVTLAWNPYAKGTRNATGVADDISGWSYMAAMGAVLKMNNNLFLGASLNYHALSITKSIVGTVASTVSNKYSSLMPMLNITLRFR
jgi:hypothetical protein